MKKILFNFFILNVLLVLLLCSCNDDNGKQTQGKIIKNAVKDADGNKYDAVKIGDQVWMAENLRTTKYDNGTSIPLGNSSSKGRGYRYYPDGKASNVNKFGYLYDWYAVMNNNNVQGGSDANPSGVQGICPKGWHVPSQNEWKEMVDYVAYQIESGELEAGQLRNPTVAKALASTEGWRTSDRSGTPGYIPLANNFTGFSAVPAGVYYFGSPQEGACGCWGESGCFWTTSYNPPAPYYYAIEFNFSDVKCHWAGSGVQREKDHAFSVRCVKD